MYYYLKEDWLLRGWDRLPTGVVRKLSGKAVFLEPGFYTRIRDMSWTVFQGSPFLTRPEKEALEQMVKQGIVGLSETPRPYTPEQSYRCYPNRFLRAVQWAVTGNCNCRCRHCYMSAPTGKIGEYSTEECLETIRQMEAAGILAVSLTGGEALVRRDFMLLAERLTEAGICIENIMSNGLLVNEALLDGLEKLGQKPEFNMSFDGIGRHDWLRGVPGRKRR